jgi:hypothetical protein
MAERQSDASATSYMVHPTSLREDAPQRYGCSGPAQGVNVTHDDDEVTLAAVAQQRSLLEAKALVASMLQMMAFAQPTAAGSFASEGVGFAGRPGDVRVAVASQEATATGASLTAVTGVADAEDTSGARELSAAEELARLRAEGGCANFNATQERRAHDWRHPHLLPNCSSSLRLRRLCSGGAQGIQGSCHVADFRWRGCISCQQQLPAVPQPPSGRSRFVGA